MFEVKAFGCLRPPGAFVKRLDRDCYRAFPRILALGYQSRVHRRLAQDTRDGRDVGLQVGFFGAADPNPITTFEWTSSFQRFSEVGPPPGLFPPTDLMFFKVESDFFQVQPPYAQQAIEVASLISLVCHYEARQWAKLFFPEARFRY